MLFVILIVIDMSVANVLGVVMELKLGMVLVILIVLVLALFDFSCLILL